MCLKCAAQPCQIQRGHMIRVEFGIVLQKEDGMWVANINTDKTQRHILYGNRLRKLTGQ